MRLNTEALRFGSLSIHSHYEAWKLGSIFVHYVYVAVYGLANEQNMVGEHTIRPRQLEPVTCTSRVSEEAEPERFRQQEIEDEDDFFHRQNAERKQADF